MSDLYRNPNGNGNDNGENVTLTRQVQAAPIQTSTHAQETENAQQVHANINEEAATIQSQHTQQIRSEENISLWSRVRNVFRRTQATDVAQGTPVQTQAPPEQTIKWYNKRSIETRMAQASNCRANYASYEAGKLLAERKTDKMQARYYIGDENIPEPVQRIAGTYSYGYKAMPSHRALADDEERRKMDHDVKFIQNFSSRDTSNRYDELENITNELLNTNISISMLSPGYMRKHAGEVSALMDRMVSYQNLKNDKKNEIYFNEGMDPLKKELIETKILSMYVPLCTYYREQLILMGIDPRTEALYKNDAEANGNYDIAKLTVKDDRKTLKKALKDSAKRAKQLNKEIAKKDKRLKKAAKNDDSSNLDPENYNPDDYLSSL